MEKIIEFFTNYYVWFILGGVVIVFIIIGYIADKKEKKNKKENIHMENKEEQQEVNVEIEKEEEPSEEVTEEPTTEEISVDGDEIASLEEMLPTEKIDEKNEESEEGFEVPLATEESAPEEGFEVPLAVEEPVSEEVTEVNPINDIELPIAEEIPTEEKDLDPIEITDPNEVGEDIFNADNQNDFL